MLPTPDERFHDESLDPTHPRRRWADPAACPGCGTKGIESHSRWRRSLRPAPSLLCCDCIRVHESYPAGFVTARGEFVEKHRDAILRIARNTEERERQARPLQRIIAITDEKESIGLTTTETDLAQAIGRSFLKAFKGELSFEFDEDVVRVHWERNE